MHLNNICQHLIAKKICIILRHYLRVKKILRTKMMILSAAVFIQIVYQWWNLDGEFMEISSLNRLRCLKGNPRLPLRWRKHSFIRTWPCFGLVCFSPFSCCLQVSILQYMESIKKNCLLCLGSLSRKPRNVKEIFLVKFEHSIFMKKFPIFSVFRIPISLVFGLCTYLKSGNFAWKLWN